MPATPTYSPLIPQNPAEILRADTCDTRRWMNPLTGICPTHRTAMGYRYVSPYGKSPLTPPQPATLILVGTYDTRRCTVCRTRKVTAQYLRGRRWLHTPATANYSLLTAKSSFTFSAKEKDVETGLSYFGSRYYSSDLSIWLSVDPMSDKYASLSPYVYCADNPVRLVDPNGEEIDEPPAWKHIDPVIPKEKFVGWKRNPDYQLIKNKKSNGEEPNCNDYAKHQLSKVNCYTTGGKDSRTLYPYSKEKGVNKEHTNKSIEYIHRQLENGVPVFVGVDEGVDMTINNGTTDHFIVIIGQGNDKRGNYFLFYDNGTGDITKGTSPNNKLYYNPKSGKISGEVKTRNEVEQTYTISEVRVTNRRKRK